LLFDMVVDHSDPCDVRVVEPQELKLALCGKKTASKLDIENAVRSKLHGCELIDVIMPAGHRDHVWDAAALALMAGER